MSVIRCACALLVTPYKLLILATWPAVADMTVSLTAWSIQVIVQSRDDKKAAAPVDQVALL